MPITAKLDEFGKPAWIALIVLGFMAWWPLGLAVLAFTIGSGRMGCGYHGGHDRWQHKMERMQRKMDWMRAKMGGGAVELGADRAATAPSTNTAPRRCAGWRKSSASSAISSTGCASPRTRPSSTLHGRAPQPAGIGAAAELNYPIYSPGSGRPPSPRRAAVAFLAAAGAAGSGPVTHS